MQYSIPNQVGYALDKLELIFYNIDGNSRFVSIYVVQSRIKEHISCLTIPSSTSKYRPRIPQQGQSSMQTSSAGSYRWSHHSTTTCSRQTLVLVVASLRLARDPAVASAATKLAKFSFMSQPTISMPHWPKWKHSVAKPSWPKPKFPTRAGSLSSLTQQGTV